MAMGPTADQIHAGLRAWAKGLYNTHAAVEFLIACGAVDDTGMFVRFDEHGQFWLDFADLDDIGWMSTGEKATWRLAHSLVRGPLGDDLWSIDQTRRRAFIKAITDTFEE